MINDFIIFTDAASDLPTELIETHGISVLPMCFEIDGKSYRHYPDDRELGYSRFYQMLRSLHVNKEGHLILKEKVRGRRKSLVEFADHMEKFCVSPEKQTIFIGHGDCIDDAGTLASIVEQRFALKNVAISYVGPIIGAHTGPDVVVLCFLGSEK